MRTRRRLVPALVLTGLLLGACTASKTPTASVNLHATGSNPSPNGPVATGTASGAPAGGPLAGTGTPGGSSPGATAGGSKPGPAAKATPGASNSGVSGNGSEGPAAQNGAISSGATIQVPADVVVSPAPSSGPVSGPPSGPVTPTPNGTPGQPSGSPVPSAQITDVQLSTTIAADGSAANPTTVFYAASNPKIIAVATLANAGPGTVIYWVHIHGTNATPSPTVTLKKALNHFYIQFEAPAGSTLPTGHYRIRYYLNYQPVWDISYDIM